MTKDQREHLERLSQDIIDSHTAVKQAHADLQEAINWHRKMVANQGEAINSWNKARIEYEANETK